MTDSETTVQSVQKYDFRSPDRISKDQLRAIQVLHENFARSLASSLSDYLRAYVSVNLISVEQLSFKEFTQRLPSPTCLVSLRMPPHEANAVLELNPSLVFPVIEMLLGGTGRYAARIQREITRIEQSILEGVHRIILQDLKSAWGQVTALAFEIQSHETGPTVLQMHAPTEALVGISWEVRIGENAGMMNIGLPSIIIKMLRHKCDQQWSVRETEVTGDEHRGMLKLLSPARLTLDARLQGPTLELKDLMQIEPGDLLQFDYAADRQLDLLVNGKLIYKGHIVGTDRKRAFSVTNVWRSCE